MTVVNVRRAAKVLRVYKGLESVSLVNFMHHVHNNSNQELTRTSIENFDFSNVQFTQLLRKTDYYVWVMCLNRRSCLATKGVELVVHDTVVVVPNSQSVTLLQIHFKELRKCRRMDVFFKDVHIVVSVWSCVLVQEAKDMAYLVKNQTIVINTTLLEGDALFATKFTNK